MAEWAIASVIALLAVLSAGHALLYKRDPRAALGWIAVCVIFPAFGPFLYFLLGINRIQTRARKLRRALRFRASQVPNQEEVPSPSADDGQPVPPEFSELARISAAVTGRPLLAGNRVELLCNGEQAYPRMLAAIDEARRSVYLMTYIFRTDQTGRRFIEALDTARARGVEVRVILDGVGELYSFPRAGTLLKRRGIPVARFLAPRLLPPAVHINLRNHRKLLVVDGRTGFTGGMNIADSYLAGGFDATRVVDTQFLFEGPVVAEMERVFLADWGFSTGDRRGSEPSTAGAGESGAALCRVIVDGPNEDLDKLALVLVGAVSSARRRISIITPYFVPPRELIAALQAAALRGVEVRVVLPAKSNLPYVHWATRNLLWELLQRGVRVFYQPPPFAHTKLFLVDDHYAQVGSANLDPRSLRLNFELAVEIYGSPVARRLADDFAAALELSREVTLAEVDNRPLPVRVRDAVAWLFSPYL